MKRPSFQFYPGDWLHDAALRSVSVGARGLWIDMLCIMHQGSDYGYLKVNHKVILTANLARMCGSTLDETEGWLIELGDAGVYSVDDNRCIFSRRMIKDEEVREARAAGGVMGGNPKLMGKNKVNLTPNLEPTPSSSSSSSSSLNTNAMSPPAKAPKADAVPYEAIINLYHQTLPICPRVAMLTTKRKGQIAARWKSGNLPDLQTWKEFFEHISKSDFLTGKSDPSNGHKRFVADLEWVTTESNFTKIAENKYHGKV